MKMFQGRQSLKSSGGSIRDLGIFPGTKPLSITSSPSNELKFDSPEKSRKNAIGSIVRNKKQTEDNISIPASDSKTRQDNSKHNKYYHSLSPAKENIMEEEKKEETGGFLGSEQHSLSLSPSISQVVSYTQAGADELNKLQTTYQWIQNYNTRKNNLLNSITSDIKTTSQYVSALRRNSSQNKKIDDKKRSASVEKSTKLKAQNRVRNKYRQFQNQNEEEQRKLSRERWNARESINKKQKEEIKEKSVLSSQPDPLYTSMIEKDNQYFQMEVYIYSVFYLIHF
jgi:hypothetical protein